MGAAPAAQPHARRGKTIRVFPHMSVSVALPAVFGRLAEQLRLQREDVVKHAIDAPALEAMVGDHTGALQVLAQRRSERTVDACLPPHLRLFEKLQAAVERKLPGPMALELHVSPFRAPRHERRGCCLLYTSDAADD